MGGFHRGIRAFQANGICGRLSPMVSSPWESRQWCGINTALPDMLVAGSVRYFLMCSATPVREGLADIAQDEL
jgi:hypothetical protein